MEHLVLMLNDVDASNLPDAGDEKILIEQDHHLISVIRNLASNTLILDDGTPDFAAIDFLFHEYGYFIFPGERDRFGWLTACLRTKKGIIVFG